jgi:ribose 5-phosphate isomerase B
MKIFMASDHAGIEVKSALAQVLKNKHQIVDLGTNSPSSVDYPDFADKVCQEVSKNSSPTEDALTRAVIGILICGSGQGMAMRANKHPLIRAALCWNLETAKLAREHNNANVLCLGARVLSISEITSIAEIFLSTKFSGERHLERVKKISKIV